MDDDDFFEDDNFIVGNEDLPELILETESESSIAKDNATSSNAKDKGKRKLSILSENSDSFIISTNRNAKDSQFDPIKFSDLLTDAIIRHDLPFKFAEYPHMREIFNYLRQNVQLVSTNTAESDLIRKYTSLKKKMKMVIDSSCSKICLTLDLWTSATTDAYICLTAHFVDKNWVLRKVILDFSLMEPPHTVNALDEKIRGILMEWEILDKVFSLTLDNDSSHDGYIEVLKEKLSFNSPLILGGEFFHIRCCAHIVNLIVQDGLKEVDGVVRKIREICKHVRGSHVKKTEFMKIARALNLDSERVLRHDEPAKWNSTFLMLRSAIHFKTAICTMDWDNASIECPNLTEWAKLEGIADFLGAFYNLAMLFSRTNYPTANLYFPLLCVINCTLKKDYEGEHFFMRDMVDRMKPIFDEYWSNYNVILAIAVILDPRYKFAFVDFAYKRLHGEDYGSIEVEMIRSKLYEMYNIYAEKLSAETPSIEKNSHSSKRPRTNPPSDVDSFLKEFDDFISSTQSTSKSQLDRYLYEEVLDTRQDLDVLNYWHGNSTRFPTLAAMAVDILSIPITAVGSESIFSGGDRVLNEERSSLNVETVQAIMCCRDWVRLLDLEEGSMDEEIAELEEEEELEELEGASEDLEEGSMDEEIAEFEEEEELEELEGASEDSL